MLTPDEFESRMARIGRGVAELQAHGDSPIAATAANLLQEFAELHAEGLRRMLAAMQSLADAAPLRERLLHDDVVRTMLLFHGLHPVDRTTRVTEAIDQLRPLIEGRGGRIDVVRVDDRSVSLRLDEGDSEGRLIRDLLEHAILIAAPDVDRVEFDATETPVKWKLPVVRS